MASTGEPMPRNHDTQARLEAAREALLERYAPETEILEIPWSAGRSPVLVLGEGPPLVLVHGGMGTALSWVPLLEHLADAHTVYAIDRPGCGLASAFDYQGVDVPRHAARFLDEAFDALGLDSATVVGNSMGGRFSIALARHHPDRVDRLILVGAPAGSEGQPVPGPVRAMRYPLIRRLMAWFTANGDAEDARDFHGQILVAQPDRMPVVFYEAMAADAAYNIHGWLPFVANVVDWSGHVAKPVRLEGPLPDLTVPTDLIWGSDDAFAGPDRGRVFAEWVDAESFTEVPEAGHLPWLDAPKTVADAILDPCGSIP